MIKQIMKMALITILAVTTFGCSSLALKREVANNVFTSSFPEITVSVAPDFKYLGISSGHTTGSTLGLRDVDYTIEAYCFVLPRNNIASKVFGVLFETIRAAYIPDFFRDKKNTLATGAVDCGGEIFQYFIISVHPSPTKHFSRVIFENGYAMPFGLIKVYGKIYGVNEDNLVHFFYYEPFENSMKDEQWKTQESLRKDQLAFMKKFSQRADLAFNLKTRTK